MEGKGMERRGMEEEGVDGESFVRIHLYVSLTIIPTLFNPLAWYAITQSDIHLLQHTLQTQENNNKVRLFFRFNRIPRKAADAKTPNNNVVAL